MVKYFFVLFFLLCTNLCAVDYDLQIMWYQVGNNLKTYRLYIPKFGENSYKYNKYKTMNIFEDAHDLKEFEGLKLTVKGLIKYRKIKCRSRDIYFRCMDNIQE